MWLLIPEFVAGQLGEEQYDARISAAWTSALHILQDMTDAALKDYADDYL